MKPLNDLIRVHPSTKQMLKSKSLTHNPEGKPTESYDSIIRRAVKRLDGEHK